MKEIKVQTDCGKLLVEEFDDGRANGVNIYLNDTLVAVVDCYREIKLPEEVNVWLSELIMNTAYVEGEGEEEEFLLDYLSAKYGYCISSFKFLRTGDKFHAFDIVWDQDQPEARLLVYGPDGEEPEDFFILN